MSGVAGLEYRVSARRIDAHGGVAHARDAAIMLDLPHKNVHKYGTISNTIAEATKLEGVIRRKM